MINTKMNTMLKRAGVITGILLSLAVSAVAQPPSHFYFNYQDDVTNRHDMVHESNGVWLEIFPDGSTKRFHDVVHGDIDGTEGTEIKADASDLYLFIPDADAGGQYPNWMRQRTNDTGWSWFQKMHDVE